MKAPLRPALRTPQSPNDATSPRPPPQEYDYELQESLTGQGHLDGQESASLSRGLVNRATGALQKAYGRLNPRGSFTFSDDSGAAALVTPYTDFGETTKAVHRSTAPTMASRVQKRRGAPAFNSSNTDRLHDEHFDLSDSTLIGIFKLLDVNRQGALTLEQLTVGLRTVEPLRSLDQHHFQQLLRHFQGQQGGDATTTLETFIQGIRSFVASMYAEGEKEIQEFFMIEYNETDVCVRSIKRDSSKAAMPMQDYGLPMSFLDLLSLPEQPADGTTRFICITGIDRWIILSLASKYRIHHLMVEDVIGSRLERPKTEEMGGVLHILLSPISVSGTTAVPLLRKGRSHAFLIDELNTIILIQALPSTLPQTLQRRIQAFSKLRLKRAPYLAYFILDGLCSEMDYVLAFYVSSLRKIHEDRGQITYQQMYLLFHLTRDLAMFGVWASPMAQLLTKLQSMLGKSDTELKMHLIDLTENAVALSEEIQLMTQWAESKSREIDSLQQFRTSKVLYLLTLTTALLLPLQLMTGYFGMNMYIPLTEDRHAYLIFWALGLTMSASILLFFRFKKWV